MTLIYIDPPHINAALYFDHSNSRKMLLEVCQQIQNAKQTDLLSIDFLPDTQFPQFAMLSDLAARLETVYSDLEQYFTQAIQIMQVSFHSPNAGTFSVLFDCIPDNTVGFEVHPISITVSGSLLAMPPNSSLKARERHKAAKNAQFLLEVFCTVCDVLDPLYGAIQVESSLPTPFELIDGQAYIGTELFVSTRLSNADKKLNVRLTELFKDGFQEQWRTGTFFSGWSVFNSAKKTVELPLLVSKQAAYNLGQAIRQYKLQY
jgi:hypothetical protein